MSFKSKINACSHIIRGYAIKWLIDIGLISPFKLLPKDSSIKTVVSLTSYGRRVNEVVFYTLVSLLRQTVLPDKIILWLDDCEWNENNIPEKLKKLTKKGVEIAYCNDVRSYTKLVPSLNLYSNKYILITVDDDVIYRSDIIESLINAHKLFPNDIITRKARFPQTVKGGFIPYNKWSLKGSASPEYIMPIGVSGVLYPPNSLHPMTTDVELFKKLCPLADDIWFWVMAKKQGTNHRVIAADKSVGDGFDDLYQFFHKGSALTHSNSKKNLNDEQLNAVIKYFDLTSADLKQGI